jgi:hypothetical protein
MGASAITTAVLGVPRRGVVVAPSAKEFGNFPAEQKNAGSEGSTDMLDDAGTSMGSGNLPAHIYRSFP